LTYAAVGLPNVAGDGDGGDTSVVPLDRPTLARLDSDTLRRQYHGYAFSEDEFVGDSDGAGISPSSSPGRGLDKRKKSFGFGSSGSLSGYAVPDTRSLKKMIKSVRGRKNA